MGCVDLQQVIKHGANVLAARSQKLLSYCVDAWIEDFYAISTKSCISWAKIRRVGRLIRQINDCSVIS